MYSNLSCRKLWPVKIGCTIDNVVPASPATKNWILQQCAMELTKKFIARIATAENLEGQVSEVIFSNLIFWNIFEYINKYFLPFFSGSMGSTWVDEEAALNMRPCQNIDPTKLKITNDPGILL